MASRALFRPAVSFPPASARSGRPPPVPPTCLASVCISLPAWTLAVRSLVTPAMRATLPSSRPAACPGQPRQSRASGEGCPPAGACLPGRGLPLGGDYLDALDGLDFGGQLVELAQRAFALLVVQLLFELLGGVGQAFRRWPEPHLHRRSAGSASWPESWPDAGSARGRRCR